MFESEKILNTIKEMYRLKIAILDVSKMRWAMTRQFNINEHENYHTENDDTNLYNGETVIINKYRNMIKGSIVILDRVILV